MDYVNGRYAHLAQCYAGYKKTGISLIECVDNQLMPTFAADDLGIYILIPKLAVFLSSSIETAITIFFNGIAIGSFLVGFIGFCFLYTSQLARLVSFFCMVSVVIFSLWKVGDVYLLYSSCAFALVPWTLYFVRNKSYISFCIFNLFAGYFIGVAHNLRAYSSLPALIFMIFFLAVTKIEMGKKVLISFGLLFGLSASMFYFSSVYNEYVRYSQKNLAEYTIAKKSHVFWHAAYCGFGFLSFANKDNIEWSDRCGEAKVLSIDPEVTIDKTDRYEAILKQEVLKIVQEQPLFFLFTVWAKIGILLLYFILFAHFGIIAALMYPNPWYINVAFFVALLMSALFPLLTIPVYAYSLGFIAFSALFAVVSINNALSKKVFKDEFV